MIHGSSLKRKKGKKLKNKNIFKNAIIKVKKASFLEIFSSFVSIASYAYLVLLSDLQSGSETDVMPSTVFHFGISANMLIFNMGSFM